jgi:hypothetical protein
MPDGTPAQSGTFSPTANSWHEVTLNSARSLAAGELVWVVVDFSAYTSGSFQHALASAYGGNTEMGLRQPCGYAAFYDGTAWSVTAARALIGGVCATDGTYLEHVGAVPFSASNTTYNSTSSTNRHANRWTPTESHEIAGIWANLDSDAAVNLVLRDSSDVAQRTIAVTPGARASNANSYGRYFFSSTYTVSSGSTIRLSVEPTTSSSVTIPLQSSDAFSAGALGVLPFGTEMVHSTFAGGAWSDNTSRRAPIGPILRVGVPGGGGSMLRHPGMGGGLVG